MKYEVEYKNRIGYRTYKLVANVIHKENPKVVEIDFGISNYNSEREAWDKLKLILTEEKVDLVIVDHENDNQISGLGEAIGWLYKIVLKDDLFTVVKDWKGTSTYLVINRDWVDNNVGSPIYRIDKYGRFEGV